MTCVNGFTNKKYICLMCKVGFMGERCEQGKKRTLCLGISVYSEFFWSSLLVYAQGKKINKFTQLVLLGELTFHKLVYLYLFFFCNCFYNVYKWVSHFCNSSGAPWIFFFKRSFWYIIFFIIKIVKINKCTNYVKRKTNKTKQKTLLLQGCILLLWNVFLKP